MNSLPTTDDRRSTARVCRPNVWVFIASLLIVAGVTLYAQLSVITGDPAWSDYTPPFLPVGQRAAPEHLGVELYNVGRSLYTGGTFANPFRDETGPTAWVAPLLPTLLAAGLVVTGGSKPALAILFLIGQVLILAALATVCIRVGRWHGHPFLAGLSFALVAACDFRYCFQLTHDSVFLAGLIGILLVGVTRERPPTATLPRACVWGIFGGICALASPIVGSTWGVATVATPLAVSGDHDARSVDSLRRADRCPVGRTQPRGAGCSHSNQIERAV